MSTKEPERESIVRRGNRLLMKLNMLLSNDMLPQRIKLMRKIRGELDFLKSSSGQLTTTNIPFYELLVSKLETEKDIIALNQRFILTLPKEKTRLIEVDIVSNDGRMWTKVKSSTLKNLERCQQSIIELTTDLVKCAKQHPIHFVTP